MGGFALDLTHLRPPIRRWSCHSLVLTQGEIFWVGKSDLHSLPWHTSFSSIKTCEEATARHRRVSPLLPGRNTQTPQAVLIPGQDHTVTPWHRLTLCPLHCPCAFWLEITQVGFPWKNCTFQSSVTPLYPLACLPAHAFSLKDGKMMTVLCRKDVVDHCDHCYFVAAAII